MAHNAKTFAKLSSAEKNKFWISKWLNLEFPCFFNTLCTFWPNSKPFQGVENWLHNSICFQYFQYCVGTLLLRRRGAFETDRHRRVPGEDLSSKLSSLSSSALQTRPRISRRRRRRTGRPQTVWSSSAFWLSFCSLLGRRPRTGHQNRPGGKRQICCWTCQTQLSTSASVCRICWHFFAKKATRSPRRPVARFWDLGGNTF